MRNVLKLLLLASIIFGCEKEKNGDDIFVRELKGWLNNSVDNPNSFELSNITVDSTYVVQVLNPLIENFKFKIDSLKKENKNDIIGVYEDNLNKFEKESKFKYFCKVSFRIKNRYNAYELKNFTLIFNERKKIAIIKDTYSGEYITDNSDYLN